MRSRRRWWRGLRLQSREHALRLSAQRRFPEIGLRAGTRNLDQPRLHLRHLASLQAEERDHQLVMLPNLGDHRLAHRLLLGLDLQDTLQLRLQIGDGGGEAHLPRLRRGSGLRELPAARGRSGWVA